MSVKMIRNTANQSTRKGNEKNPLRCPVRSETLPKRPRGDPEKKNYKAVIPQPLTLEK